jgi:response regulator NasT
MPTRLLVAQCDRVIRMDLKETLQRHGYRVVAAVGDGVNAVALARQLRPDLVITCIRMPGMDGLTVARILLDEQVAPVMVLSAMCDEDLVARARDAGVMQYLTKPWRERELIAAIDVALARHREFCALARQVQTLEERLATRRVIERAARLLMERYALDEGEAFRRIQRFCMTSRRSMREVAEAIILAYETLAPAGPHNAPDTREARAEDAPRGEGDEEAARRAARMEVERARARLAEVQRAEQRAEALLREHLSADEWQQLASQGYLEVPSTLAPGRRYRIPWHGGRPQVYERDRLVAHLCIGPVEPLPPSDLVLLHMLLIRSDEANYLATANRLPA